MDRSREELEELVQHANALRATLARMRSDLSAATAAEQALTAKLRALGIAGIEDDDDDAKTMVDPMEASGLPRRIFASRAEAPPSSLRAAGVGAALVIGLAGVLLLAVNVLVARRTEAPVAVAPTSPSAPSTATAARDDSRAIPPPPPREAAEAPAPAPPSLASAVLPKNAETPAASPAPALGNGFLTVLCAPKCDSISDNNEALIPSNVVSLPVAAGSHKLMLGSANGVRKTLLVNVAPGQTREVRVSMEAPGRDYGF